MTDVPLHLRPAVARALDALVRGDHPELLRWVHAYGAAGTALVAQPEAVWTHPRTQVDRADQGGWHLVLPLWTVDESPSDLSVEATVTPEGVVHLCDLHVL